MQYSYTGVVSLSNTIRNLFAAVMTSILAVTLFDAVFHVSKIITPGVSNIYNSLGTKIAPGESIILLTAGLVVLLVFGRGRLGGKL